MNTEQDNKRVSAFYREVADEVTPTTLDERILADAARGAQSRYGLARAWVRPVAWAATIGLSLAFLLELTWFADAPPEVPAGSPAVSEERARQDADVMRAKQEDVPNRSIAKQATPPAAANGAPAAPATDEASFLRQAGTQAREEAERAQIAAVLSPAESADQDHACDNEARETAESWYQCIRELRAQGLDDDADTEFEALLRAFPDFSEPLPE